MKSMSRTSRWLLVPALGIGLGAMATTKGEAQMAHATKAAPPAGDIVQVAMAAGNFNTLATALTAAGLVETLKGPGPYTVFAPTDAAFARIPKATLDALLADRARLTAVLTYHVVAGKVTAAEVTTLSSVPTVSGQPLRIKVEGGTVLVNDARVTATDIAASNGVIHVIDAVLMPKQ